MDISADLDELARTPVTVVCAGPKSILDVGRTLEALETRGVPVVGWQSDEVAGFYSRGSGHRSPSRVDSAEQAARLITIQRGLGLATGILVTVPLPPEMALPDGEVAAAVEQAEAEAAAAGIHGPASTPFVLGRVAALTDGRSVRANLALIERDASVAGQIAVALAALRRCGMPRPEAPVAPDRLADPANPDHSTGPTPPDVPCQPGGAGLSSRVVPFGLRAPASPGRQDVATGRSTEALDAHL